MSKIFELFGYRLDRWNDDAAANRARAWCPFMNRACDGGGNRYLSALNLDKNPTLSEYFPGLRIVQAGVCSLQLQEGQQPWIVCPRRLLSLKGEVESTYQQYVRQQVASCSGLLPGKCYRVWSEIKMKLEAANDDDEMKSFDYTFDYLIAGSVRRPLDQVCDMVEFSPKKVLRLAQANGLTLAFRNGETWIEDFPGDVVTIIEVMTSSTSGGDKNKRTQVAMACEDAIRDPSKHNGPGINYRQVWARMVSQLIVKSEVGTAWNARTLWLIQDLLADYISKTTALNLDNYRADTLDAVNILAFGYGDLNRAGSEPIVPLTESTLYSGPVSEGTERGFIKIVKMGAAPKMKSLWRSLLQKPSSGSICG